MEEYEEAIDHPADCDGLCYDCDDGDWCEFSAKTEH